MSKPKHPTPQLDELDEGRGPWPSFVKELKRLAEDTDMMGDLVGQMEHSYETRTGYWKGGAVTVSGYGGGVIPRYSLVADKFPASSEFHTLRIMPPGGMHYRTSTLRQLCDIWEKHGSGLIALHGQSGDIMLQGCTKEKVQEAFDELNEAGWDMGGAGPGVRTSMSCVGPARCEQACYDTSTLQRKTVNHFVGEMHRPGLPYKFKWKFSGCTNDCMNSLQRSDMSVQGTWRDDIKVDQDAVKDFVQEKGRSYVIDNVVTRCPTRSLKLTDDDTLDIDNRNCVRCMHCINVMPQALSPGDDKGVTILLGGKRTLKVGDILGTVIVPFMKVDTEEQQQEFIDLSERIMEFWTENALEHERIGEFIERIGLARFLEGVGLEPDPSMVNQPRSNPYVRIDDDADFLAQRGVEGEEEIPDHLL